MLETVENIYSSYSKDTNNTWRDRFTWRGLWNNEYLASISIGNFFKSISNIDEFYDKTIKNSSAFQKWVFKTAPIYVDYCEKTLYKKFSDEEKNDLRNFYVGAMGEYFFLNILNNFKKFAIDKKAVSFNHSAPLLPTMEDFGIDGTTIVSYDKNTKVSAAIQVKFWSEYSSFKMTMDIAQKAFGQAILDDYIEKNENKNIIICWLGNDEKCSKYLKQNKKLMQHVIFFDRKVLDNNIDDIDDYFWSETLPSWMSNIKNF